MLASAAGALIRPARAVEPPRLASDFCDSVGVNVHVGSEPYASRFARFLELLAASNIRHVRDELRPDNDLQSWRGLHAAGMTSHWLVSPATNTVAQMLGYLGTIGPDNVSAVEGQNEGDSDWFMAHEAAQYNWSATVVAYQRDVFNALRGHYPRIPVVSPTLLDWKPGDVWLIRRAAPYCDIAAIHAYVQHGQEPETEDSWAALSWYLSRFRDTFKPGAPVMATETGYTNFVRPSGAGISEAASAIYLPRLLLHNFAAGVLRTFLYEFMDGGVDPADSEHHYGLVRNDGSPKPAYDAIRRLLAALRNPPAGTAAAAAPEPSSGVPADLRRVAFRHADGGITTALWRAARSWDPARAADISVAPVPVTVAVADGVPRVAWMTPNDGGAWVSGAVVGGRITIPVGDKVLLLRTQTAG